MRPRGRGAAPHARDVEPHGSGGGHQVLGEPAPGPLLVYGRNPVREALRGRRRVHAVLVGTGSAARGRGTDAAASEGGVPAPTLEHSAGDLAAKVVEWCRETGMPVPPVRRVAFADLTALLHTPDHQGIAAEVDPYPYLEPEELLAGHTLVVALDGVQDPHNLGAVIRTAEGVGAGVVIPRHRAAGVTAAVVKTSAGATEHAAVAQVRNLADFLSEAKDRGFWIYGAAAGARSEYTTQDYTYPTCFVLGSEGEGLGRRVASLCDVMVGLPLEGRVESLNVSVSAGVLLYEAVRQRGVRRAGERAGTRGPAETGGPAKTGGPAEGRGPAGTGDPAEAGGAGEAGRVGGQGAAQEGRA